MQVRPDRNPDPVREAVCLLVVVAVTLLAFWPVLQNGFVNWDDPAYITRNPLLHLPLPAMLRSAWTTFPLGNYHPLTTVGQALLHAVFGPSPLAYHLVSLLTHLFNLLLVYVLLRRFGCSVYAAGAATLLFAVHPLRVEAVAWASAQKDLWCAGFVLIALHAYLSYVRSDEGRGKRHYGICLVAFCLALLAKGTAMVLPLLLCLVDLALGREQGGRRRWLDKIPFFALAVLFGAIALVARSSFQAVLEEAPAGGNLIWLAAYRLVTYGLNTLAPLPHRFPVYPPAGRGDLAWEILTLLGVSVVLAVCLWRWRDWRTEVAGVAFFAVGLAPALPLENLGYAADRFTYLAAIGLALSGAAVFDRLLTKMSPRQLAAAAVVILLGGVTLTCASWRLSGAWHDSNRLISEYIELYRANPGRETYLALALETRAEGRRLAGDEESARTDFAAAREAWPEWAPGLLLAGEELMGQGRLDEAAAMLDRAARLDPANARIFAGRAIVHRRMGRLQAALADAEEAVRLAPADAVAFNSRGAVLQALNRPEEALVDFGRAVALAPDSAMPLINRALVFVALGASESALADLEAALRIDPQNELAQEWVTKLRGR